MLPSPKAMAAADAVSLAELAGNWSTQVEAESKEVAATSPAPSDPAAAIAPAAIAALDTATAVAEAGWPVELSPAARRLLALYDAEEKKNRVEREEEEDEEEEVKPGEEYAVQHYVSKCVYARKCRPTRQRTL